MPITDSRFWAVVEKSFSPSVVLVSTSAPIAADAVTVNSTVPEDKLSLKLREVVSVGTDIILVLSSAHPTTTSNDIATDSLKAEPINGNKILFDANLCLLTTTKNHYFSVSALGFSLYINRILSELYQPANN